MKRYTWIKEKLSAKRLYFICQQLSFALESGMSMSLALRITAGEMTHPTSRKFLQEILTAIEQGKMISQALEETAIQYSPVFLEFVLAGEQNGTMLQALQQAAEYFQQQDKTGQMLFSALCYPVILMALMIVAFGAMLLFVVPAMVETYQNLQAELPQVAKTLLFIEDWMRQYWMHVLIGTIVSAVLLYFLSRKSLQQLQVRNAVKRIILAFPFIGKLYQQYWFIQISQGLGLMLNSGMLLVSALQAIRQIYQRSLFSDELNILYNQISSGHMWADCLQQCNFVPKLAQQMLVISEQSGMLPTAILQLNRYYQQQFQQRLHILMNILEPCMIVLMGIGILAVAGSLFLPLVQSYQYLM